MSVPAVESHRPMRPAIAIDSSHPCRQPRIQAAADTLLVNRQMLLGESRWTSELDHLDVVERCEFS